MVAEPRSMDMPSRNGRARRTLAWALLAGLFALGLFAAPVNAADRAKTLRVVRTKALKSGKFDYDAPIPGLEAVDRYTLRIRLKAPDLRFLYVFAVPNTAAVAREVVEAYGLDFGAHPVGTGPYMLGEYRRTAKIVLLANPGFRDTTYVPAGPVPPETMPIAAALDGKKLPLAGRIQITVIEEGQAVWLAFVNRELDLLERI